MTDHDKFFMLTKELTEILNARRNLKPPYSANRYVEIPRKLCKAKIRRLRLELNDVLKEIESKCRCMLDATGEEWYNE